MSGLELLGCSNACFCEFYFLMILPEIDELLRASLSSCSYNSQRPVLVSWPNRMRYGRMYFVTYHVGSTRREQNLAGEETAVVECNLHSAPFVTHSYAQGQRQLKLKTELMWGWSSKRTLLVTAPPNGNVAPAQYYMLFVLRDGIPGSAKWVQITP